MSAAGPLLGYDPNQVKPGWIAFFVVMLLLVATFLLWRNMNKQMGKIKVPYRHEFRDDSTASPDDVSSPPSPPSLPPTPPTPTSPPTPGTPGTPGTPSPRDGKEQSG